MKPNPESCIRLETLDGQVIERTLRDISISLVDDTGGYRTSCGGYYRPATESCPIEFRSARMPPGTIY